MRDHTKLRAFELADELAIFIYAVTRKFPKSEMYGLTSQMRRAAVSVPSNIVEGCARESQAEYLRFLEIAFGSLRELDYQYSLAKRLRYTEESEPSNLEAKMNEAQKVLGGLIRSMRKSKKLQPTVYSLQPTVYSPQSTAHSLQSTAHSLQPTVYSLQPTAYSLFFVPSSEAGERF